MTSSARDRLKAGRYGRWAETVSAWYLRLIGYKVLARGWRVPSGEIDIVAAKGGHLVAVEVKARQTLDAAAESLTPRQRGRIVRAASAFCQAHPAYAAAAVRFDVMLVRPWRLPVHIVDAWQ